MNHLWLKWWLLYVTVMFADRFQWWPSIFDTNQTLYAKGWNSRHRHRIKEEKSVIWWCIFNQYCKCLKGNTCNVFTDVKHTPILKVHIYGTDPYHQLLSVQRIEPQGIDKISPHLFVQSRTLSSSFCPWSLCTVISHWIFTLYTQYVSGA